MQEPQFFDRSTVAGELAERYLQSLLAGERHDASTMILQAAEEGMQVRDIYLGVFQPVLYEVGRLWQHNRISVAEEHFITAVTQLTMSQLYPRIFTAERKEFTLVATCVGDELHEVGVRMVADFFEMEGWDTYYLGANSPHQSVVEAVVDRRAHLLAISATMSFHLPNIKQLIAAVRNTPETSGVKVLVGGYCFNAFPDLWRQTGADATAADAEEAVRTARRFVEGT